VGSAALPIGFTPSHLLFESLFDLQESVSISMVGEDVGNAGGVDIKYWI
jgi:hypothetical protein